MAREIMTEDRLHPDIREKVSNNHRDIVEQVQKAIESNDVVVVGMTVNPNVSRARKALDNAGVEHKYLGYGGYHNDWRRRNALKMWTGWPTFPMVFVKGMLIGGADDTERLIKADKLKELLA